MKEVSIRLLYRTGGDVEDGQHDLSLDDFGGNVPAAGDRIAIMLQPEARFVRILERVFEAEGGNRPYINLIVEEDDGSDLRNIPRFF